MAGAHLRVGRVNIVEVGAAAREGQHGALRLLFRHGQLHEADEQVHLRE